MPSQHPPEFRRRDIELARQGDEPLVQPALDLEISCSCPLNRMNQTDATAIRQGETGRTEGAHNKELAELWRCKRPLETDNKILKRAAAASLQYPGKGVLCQPQSQ